MSPKPSANFDAVTPVILSSPFSILANNSAIPDFGRIAYPYRKAIYIEEIRWTLYATPATSQVAATQLGSQVLTKLQFGNKYLMRDPVPIWLLGTTMDLKQEETQDVTVNLRTSYSHYRWRLPEPLYLEAGEVLGSWFTRGPELATVFPIGTINGYVEYVGRTVSPQTPRPKTIPVPYAAPFVTTLGRVYQQSNEEHLFNPFGVDLRVQRFNGRLLQTSADSAQTASRRLGLTVPPSAPTSGMGLLMNDSWGGKMVNNLTGPGDIFDCLRAGWLVDTVMPPKGVYEIRAWNMPVDQQLHVAMVGVREERA